MPTLAATSRITTDRDVNVWIAFLRPFFILLAIFLTFYFSALSHFTLGIDDESGALRTEPVSWARQGRWLLYVLEKWIIPQPTIVFFPIFFFGLFSSLGYLLLTIAYRLDLRDPRTYMLFVLFCAFPTLFYIANFMPNILGLAVGLAAACLAIYCFSEATFAENQSAGKRRPRPVLLLLTLACVAIAIGAYQSLLLVILIGCSGLLARELSVDVRLTYRRFFVSHLMLAVSLVGGVLVSEVISHVVRAATGLDTGYISEWYADGYLQPGQLLRDPLFVTGAALKELKAVYGGSAEVYGYTYYTFPVLLLLGLAGLIHSFAALKRDQQVFYTIYAAGILLVPFFLNLLTGGQLPYRALIAVPIVFWLFGMFAVFSRNRYIRVISVLTLAVVILQSLYTFSMLQTTRRLALAHDMQLASHIFDRVAMTVPDFDRTRIYPIDFYGAYEFETIYPRIRGGNTLSASFFQWDQGNPRRIHAFMTVLGYSNFRHVTEESRANLILEMMSMPVWPQRDAVKFVDGTVLVRLGQKPSPVHAKLVDDAIAHLSAPAFWVFNQESSSYHLINSDIVKSDQSGLTLSSGNDVQFVFSTGQSELLRRCSILRVNANVAADQPDVAQLFYLQGAMSHFAGSHHGRATVGGDAELGFVLTSPDGFQDRFRLDPVMKPQESRIAHITFHCLQVVGN